MHNTGIIKAALALSVVTTFCAYGQFGGALNKMKKSASAAVSSTAAHQTPCPWVLEKDYSRETQPLQDYYKQLGTTSNSKVVGDFRKQLRARVAEDEKIVAAGSSHPLYEQAKEELDRYDFFLGWLGQRLYFIFNGKVELEKNNVAFDYAMLRTKTSNVRVMSKDGKNVYFFQNGDRVFVEGEDMEEINQQVRQLFYSYFFFDGLNKPEYRKSRAIAITCFNYTRQAMKNNKPENVDYHPMPKPGKLNTLAPKALALARKSSSYADAIDVVIDADDWTIERNSIGIILRRKVGAWVIKQMKRSKRAYRCQFAEPYTGNGYGELRLHGVGGGQFNIK